MADTFANLSKGLGSPATDWFAITPDDNNDLAVRPRAIRRNSTRRRLLGVPSVRCQPSRILRAIFMKARTRPPFDGARRSARCLDMVGPPLNERGPGRSAASGRDADGAAPRDASP